MGSKERGIGHSPQRVRERKRALTCEKKAKNRSRIVGTGWCRAMTCHDRYQPRPRQMADGRSGERVCREKLLQTVSTVNRWWKTSRTNEKIFGVQESAVSGWDGLRVAVRSLCCYDQLSPSEA